MEDSCPVTPLILPTGRDSKSPVHRRASSPESDGMKSPSGRVSPDSRCVICLGRLQNKSFTDSCLHQFCFQCLLQWSKVKPECPLCKQPFKSIIHNVRSNVDYDQYEVQREPAIVIQDVFSYNFDLIPVDRRFRYRSTMTREYFREIAESFLARTRRLQDEPYQIPPLMTRSNDLRRPNRVHAHTLYQRLRQRGTSEFRRSVYTQNMWVQDLPDVSGRYRECTPEFYRNNPAQIHRMVPWLNRELNVLMNDCDPHAAYVLDRILSTLSMHPIRSLEFREIVQPYIGGRTTHFLHEFYTFARSVYDIAGFDQHATYVTDSVYSDVVQELSSTSDDSEIEVLETVTLTESRCNEHRGLKKTLLRRAAEQGEPVAGPSGLSVFNNASEPIEIEESDPDEVEVVNFVKPEPQVVTLSDESDGTGEVEDMDDTEELHNLAVDITLNELSESESIQSVSSGECFTPTRCNQRYRSAKGKSNGVGLKGRQKRKYARSFVTSNSVSSSSSNEDSDHKPIAKLIRRKKRKDARKIKKKVKKSVREKRRRRISSSPTPSELPKEPEEPEEHEEPTEPQEPEEPEKHNSRKRVRSAVVVPPDSRQEDSKDSIQLGEPYTLQAFKKEESISDEEVYLAPYWSLGSNSSPLSGVKKERKRKWKDRHNDSTTDDSDSDIDLDLASWMRAKSRLGAFGARTDCSVSTSGNHVSLKLKMSDQASTSSVL